MIAAAVLDFDDQNSTARTSLHVEPIQELGGRRRTARALSAARRVGAGRCRVISRLDGFAFVRLGTFLDLRFAVRLIDRRGLAGLPAPLALLSGR